MHNELIEAKRLLKIADHMVYITYPVLKEQRLLIKILSQINDALNNTISAVLNHEYLQKNIKKYSDSKMNFEAFIGCCPEYNIDKTHINIIKKVSGIMEMHSKSPLEFIRKDQFVIMSDNLKTEPITIERLKIFLHVSQQIFEKTIEKIAKDGRPQ